MVFGVSTACMYPKNLEQVIDQYGEMGIRDTEIFVNTFCELSPEFIRALENKVNQYKMRVHAFHPFTSGSMNVVLMICWIFIGVILKSCSVLVPKFLFFTVTIKQAQTTLRFMRSDTISCARPHARMESILRRKILLVVSREIFCF